MNSSKVNSKLHNERRLYLKYKGSAEPNGGSTYSKRRSPYLVHDNDLAREYDLEEDEPKLFMTDEVMEEFRVYLEDVVLKMVMSHPIPMEKIDRFAPELPIKFPEALGPFFCFGEWRDAERIKQGKSDPTQLPPDHRYGLIGNGYRLMSLDVPDDGSAPKKAYDGFLWCGIGEVTKEMPTNEISIPGSSIGYSRDQFLIRVKPDRANGIYIADHFQYEKRRKELGEAMEKGRDRYTSTEIADFIRARARTLIPIEQYKGGYEMPVVLINRELSFDEVEIVGGPRNDHM